jgi:hypothetical protein
MNATHVEVMQMIFFTSAKSINTQGKSGVAPVRIPFG